MSRHLLALSACVACATSTGRAQTRATFATLLGKDTVSVERFERWPNRLTGSIETRVNGRTSRVTYSVLKDAHGRPIRLEYSLTVPQQGLSTAALDIVGDSAIGPVMLADKESVYRGAFPRGAIPVLYPLSVAMLEDAARTATATRDQAVFAWGNQKTGATSIAIARVDARHIVVAELGGLHVAFNTQGELVSADGMTSAVSISRSTTLTSPASLLPSPSPRGLAPTPPMGWNSWNKFGCNISESLIRETADAMVSSGMLAAGYTYLNIDDCWEARARDAAGNLAVDSARFPSGMKALVDYVHAKGLKVGIYSSGGTGTCQRRPATLDHEVADARLFANWNIDYLKYDNCNAQGRPEQVRYKAMIDAVKAAGREMVFSVCEWGEARPWLWARELGGQLWRTTEDIRDSWMSVLGILDQQVGLDVYAGPNGWNDPDMLEIGNGRMTYNQYVAHFSLWALLNAPLIAGNDLRAMNDSTRAILMNKAVVAVDQDWSGRQGYRFRDDGALEVWVKPMSDGSTAVVFLNRSAAAAPMDLVMNDLRAVHRTWWQRIFGPRMRHRVHDLWSNQTVLSGGDVVRRIVPAEGAVMLRVDEAQHER